MVLCLVIYTLTSRSGGLRIYSEADVLEFALVASRIEPRELQNHVLRNVDNTISMGDPYDNADLQSSAALHLMQSSPLNHNIDGLMLTMVRL